MYSVVKSKHKTQENDGKVVAWTSKWRLQQRTFTHKHYNEHITHNNRKIVFLVNMLLSLFPLWTCSSSDARIITKILFKSSLDSADPHAFITINKYSKSIGFLAEIVGHDSLLFNLWQTSSSILENTCVFDHIHDKSNF